MPDASLPTCRQWAPRQDWQADDFPFVIRFPNCTPTACVGDVGFRMTVTPAQPPPASWPAGHGIPGQRPTPAALTGHVHKAPTARSSPGPALCGQRLTVALRVMN